MAGLVSNIQVAAFDTHGKRAAQTLQGLEIAQSQVEGWRQQWVLMQTFPIASLLGAFYMGTVIYAAQTTLEYQSSEESQKFSPNIRKTLKVAVGVPFALLGAWLCARSYQNWLSGPATAYALSLLPEIK